MAPKCPTKGSVERTLALLLPAVVAEGGVDAVLAAVKRAGLRVVVAKYVTMTSDVSCKL